MIYMNTVVVGNINHYYLPMVYGCEHLKRKHIFTLLHAPCHEIVENECQYFRMLLRGVKLIIRS